MKIGAQIENVMTPHEASSRSPLLKNPSDNKVGTHNGASSSTREAESTRPGASSPTGEAESTWPGDSLGNQPEAHDAQSAQWFVLRDLKRSNAKNPAYKFLPTLGIETFTPMHWVIKDNPRGGKKREHTPFMPSLLFAKSTRQELDEIILRTETLQYRFVKGAPQGTVMTVPTVEMTRFIQGVNETKDCTFFTPDEVTPDMIGRTVLIKGGPFDGHIGPLLRTRGTRKRRLIVNLQGLITAAIEISPQYIQLID